MLVESLGYSASTTRSDDGYALGYHEVTDDHSFRERAFDPDRSFVPLILGIDEPDEKRGIGECHSWPRWTRRFDATASPP